LEIETEVVVPSRFGGEYYDNVTPISVRQDYLDGVSSPNM